MKIKAGLMFQTVAVALAWIRFWKQNKEVLEAWLEELEAGLTPEEKKQLEEMRQLAEDENGLDWERRLAVMNLFMRNKAS